MVKNLPANAVNARDAGSIPGLERSPLEEGMATHSSIPNWEVPWTEEPCRLSPWSLKESDTTERLTQVCVLKQLNSFSLSPYPLVTTILFCFMSLAFLDPRVSHTVFVFLNLTSHLALIPVRCYVSTITVPHRAVSLPKDLRATC